MNTDKTKVMTFYKGRLPETAKGPFHANNVDLESVNEFIYLGVTFTTQLAFTKQGIHRLMIRPQTKTSLP